MPDNGADEDAPKRDADAPLPVLDPVTDYEKIHRIGEGTYGVVYKAREIATGKLVALKKIRFEVSRDGVPVTSIRELRVLQQCKHQNIVQLKKVVTGSKADSVFFVFEYCEHDLGRLLDSVPNPFTEAEVKCLLKQLLAAVEFLHERGVMHRDLKLSNLLYTRHGVLKLCDFGLARYRQPADVALTPDVVTLWYRAPEVLLGSTKYGGAVDLWGVGCIMAELLRGKPLFPAEGEAEVLRMMFAVLGAPSERIWPGLSSLPRAAKLQPPPDRLNRLSSCLPGLSQAGLQLLNSLLTYDPERRITARDALRHPYFKERPFCKHYTAMPTFPSTHVVPRPRGDFTGGQTHRHKTASQQQHAGTAGRVHASSSGYTSLASAAKRARRE